MEKTVCELFAGVGGFRLGLEAADPSWKTVWMNQWEPSRKRQDAYDCYCAHFGHKKEYVNEDIASIDKKTIPDHTLLVGGFPCQDYSVAHTGAKGIEGKKGVLWWQIYDILKEKQAPFVFLENVDRLLKSPARQRGRDFGIILASFWALGYSLEWRVVNAAEYGFATAAGAPSSSRTARIPHTAKKSSPQKTVSLGTASLPRHSRSKKALL